MFISLFIFLEILNTLPLYIDHRAPSNLKLTIEGRGDIGDNVWVFKNQSNSFHVSKLGLKVFIQTDRPIYKPGQTSTTYIKIYITPHLSIIIEYNFAFGKNLLCQFIKIEYL